MAAHTHATVKPSFWTGKTGKKLRAHPDAQRLAFYLMTSPHRLMTGLYYIPKLYITHELGLEGPEIDAAFELLSSDTYDFAHYDAEAELVFVTNLAEHQIGPVLKGGEKPDKKISNVLKLIAPYKGHPLYARFGARYNESYCLNLESMGGASKGHLDGWKGLGKPLLPVPVPVPVPVPALDPADGDPLNLFGDAWRELTGRSDFGDGCGQYTGTEVHALQLFRKACGGSVAEFRQRVTARLTGDRNNFNLSQTLIRWSTDLINLPAKLPAATTTRAPNRSGPAIARADTDYELEEGFQL